MAAASVRSRCRCSKSVLYLALPLRQRTPPAPPLSALWTDLLLRLTSTREPARRHVTARLFPVCLLALLLAVPSSARVHSVRSGETLSHVATRYGISVGDLRRWNGLTSDRIVVGQRLTVALGETWTVRPGDTLSGIGLRTGLTLGQLRAWNGLASDAIRVGQTLRLRQPAPAVRTANRAGVEPGHVVVRPGDTLSEIALAHGTTVARLRSWNSLSGDGIRVGQSLRVTTPTAPARPGRTSTYTVRRGDNLSTIASRHGLSVEDLRRLNDLDDDRIHPGQRLALRAAPGTEVTGIHVVQRGETLSEIAAVHRIGLSELRRLNGIDGDLIRPGQKLHLRATPTTVHIVQRGDALWEIARAYGMTVADLTALNGLTGHRIYPGQELRVSGDDGPVLTTYRVARGDNLSEIAQLHQMSVAELQGLNDLRGTVIHPGQELKVRPLLGQTQRIEISQIPWEELFAGVDGLRVIEADNGPYFGQRPKAGRQKSRSYSELHPPSPLKTYRQARTLWKAFERRVEAMGRVSDDLAGWHIVLDPGHGGIDPGAIVPTVDGNGRTLYVVEDEYVYDITLRAYVLLRLHGARVDVTLLSPNHLIRHTTPPTETFVHEMNEVFNSHSYNRRNRPEDWPKGTSRGLKERVRIAEEAFRGVSRDRTMFLSLHADIDARAREGAVVLYYESRHQRDDRSRRFARALLPALGAGAHTRGQSLAVLRNNPAGVKALVEVRNLAFVDHAWALRFEQARHRDAEKIVKGVLDYARGQRLARR
jgi:LysM repeat protein/N-acetylmuramoyl-L-alanine amidase